MENATQRSDMGERGGLERREGREARWERGREAERQGRPRDEGRRPQSGAWAAGQGRRAG